MEPITVAVPLTPVGALSSWSSGCRVRCSSCQSRSGDDRTCQFPVDPEVIFGHSPCGKAALKRLPDVTAIQILDPAQCRRSFDLAIHDKARRAVFDNLGYRD